MQSLSCKRCTFDRKFVEVVVMLVLCRTSSQACTRLVGHHRHWLAKCNMSSTTKPAARYSGLKGCQLLRECYLLPPACRKVKLTPFKKFSSSKRGLCHLHAWKELTWCQYGRQGHFVWCAVFLQCWDLPISVRKSTNIALWVLVMHCLLIEATRRWNSD